MVMVDTQEVGIRLVHALGPVPKRCRRITKAADVSSTNLIFSSQGGAMRKVAGYFAEALQLAGSASPPSTRLLSGLCFSDILKMHFYELPLKFAHFTASRPSSKLRRLPPRFTGPHPSAPASSDHLNPDNNDALQQVGGELAQLADTIHIDFEYRGFVANSLADLEPYMLGPSIPADGESSQVVAINSIFELHRLLALPGALERSSPPPFALSTRVS
ncbi:hypothetical protein HPP92_027702 [Vanilla planifolia]|uniref:DELLA protein n=1 Tax=Vanilla planifolia TaxID=51239 RepID=A0A835PE09_VANPL|nr:hypothetical protein HPP92_027702 [Vanilla planifolia]